VRTGKRAQAAFGCFLLVHAFLAISRARHRPGAAMILRALTPRTPAGPLSAAGHAAIRHAGWPAGSTCCFLPRHARLIGNGI